MQKLVNWGDFDGVEFIIKLSIHFVGNVFFLAALLPFLEHLLFFPPLRVHPRITLVKFGLRELITAKDQVYPWPKVLPNVFGLKRLSVNSHHVVMVKGPFRQEPLVLVLLRQVASDSKMDIVFISQYLRQVEELRIKLCVQCTLVPIRLIWYDHVGVELEPIWIFGLAIDAKIPGREGFEAMQWLDCSYTTNETLWNFDLIASI
jgi:hypothetical protein